jgi:hypothetical protein
VSGDHAWNVVGESALPVPLALAERQLQLWTTSHGVIKAAAAYGATVQRRTIAFAVPARFAAKATVDDRSLIENVEAAVSHPVLGDNRQFFERVLATPATVSPDPLTRSGRKGMVEAVRDQRVLTDGTRTVEIGHIAGNLHHDGLLMVSLPRSVCGSRRTPSRPGRRTRPRRARRTRSA